MRRAAGLRPRRRCLSRVLNGVSQAQGQVYYSSYHGYYGNNYVRTADGTIHPLAQIQNALGDEAKAALAKLWDQVDNATAQVRLQMTMKYMTDF